MHADHANTPEGSAPTRRILLVDDEPAVAQTIQRVLERRGFTVHIATDGASALAMLETHGEVDLVITDQTMPAMTGVELIEQVRSRGLTTPVILASGYSAAIDDQRLESFTGVWRIDKPFGTGELFALVARALAGSRG
jgi:two-component system, cell cycle sensor histidine kinase and response regulator CckA